MKLFTRRYRAEPPAAVLARSQVSAFAAESGFTDTDLADIECATGEAIANAIEHGNQATGRFTLTCAFADGLLRIEVKDAGAGFIIAEPRAAPPRAALRGWGLFMMRAFMDRVTFAEGGSLVRMEKRLRRRLSSPNRPV